MCSDDENIFPDSQYSKCWSDIKIINDVVAQCQGEKLGDWRERRDTGGGKVTEWHSGQIGAGTLDV